MRISDGSSDVCSSDLAIVVLAMNFDQICANFPEQRSRAGLIVDKGPTASINPQCTADDQRFARFDVDAIFGQNGPERVPGTRLKESGGYARSFLTLPHQAAVGPRPKGKPKGVEKNGLACPRLAGQHPQTRTEFQVERLDQNHVADGKARQHEDGPLSGRSEEHPSELQSLLRISDAVLCLNK